MYLALVARLTLLQAIAAPGVPPPTAPRSRGCDQCGERVQPPSHPTLECPRSVHWGAWVSSDTESEGDTHQPAHKTGYLSSALVWVPCKE